MNFGAIGPYLTITIFYIFITFMERLKSKGMPWLVLYSAAVAQIPTFVLYGLENFGKTLLLFTVCAIALNSALTYRKKAVKPI